MSSSNYSESSTSSISTSSTSSCSSMSSDNFISESSTSSLSSSSSLTDCIDWRITEALLEQLKIMSKGYNTQVKTVQLIEAEFKTPSEFPVIFVCPNEIDPDQEYASRNDTLPFALIYIDDSTETNLHYRFRNVPADIQKCLKKNPTMNGLAHYTQVVSWENSVFLINDIEIACCIVYINIERRLDASDPYKLA